MREGFSTSCRAVLPYIAPLAAMSSWAMVMGCRWSWILNTPTASTLILWRQGKNYGSFWNNSCESIRSVSRLIFYMWMYSCSRIICWKEYLFFVWLSLLLYERSVDYICMYLHLFHRLYMYGSVSVPLIYPFFILLPIPHCFDYCTFIVRLEAWYVSLLTSLSFFNIVLTT